MSFLPKMGKTSWPCKVGENYQTVFCRTLEKYYEIFPIEKKIDSI